MTITFSAGQEAARDVLSGPNRYGCLVGGTRSGKTFLIVRNIVVRALKGAGSRHALLRFRANAARASIALDTLPTVMRRCFPNVTLTEHRQDGFFELPNGSQFWIGGLDDKDRVEKILGTEFSTIFLNEASQIPYSSATVAFTRLAQVVPGIAQRAYVDLNPIGKGHWTNRLFGDKRDPVSGKALANPEAYARAFLNPRDNAHNLSADFIASLEALPERARRRFYDGIYVDEVDGALWTLDLIDKRREARWQTEADREALLNRMQRIVVGVDPSGCSGPEDTRSDEIGIVVAGIDRSGAGFVLEDVSGRYSPEGWARQAVSAMDRWRGDAIVAERNFGGAMVESTIRAARATAPVRLVTASRGKTVRAEPVAALYEQGRVTHVEAFPDMEEQFCNFSTGGYQGSKSPDRADAAVWALTDLMLGDAGTYDPSLAWV